MKNGKQLTPEQYEVCRKKGMELPLQESIIILRKKEYTYVYVVEMSYLVQTMNSIQAIDFKKSDVFRFTPAKKFDILVSNLVFHNFGKMRFEAYSRLSSWIHAISFIVMGDLFFSHKTDIAHLSKTFRILRQIKPKRGFGQYALLIMSKDSGQAHMN